MIGLAGDNLGTEGRVGGEYAMAANEMEAISRDNSRSQPFVLFTYLFKPNPRLLSKRF